MKYEVRTGTDAIYVYPACAFRGRPLPSFIRARVRRDGPSVYELYTRNGNDDDAFQSDRVEYLNAGGSVDEIRRVDAVVKSVASMVFDPSVSVHDNVVAIACAINGVLKEEGLA